MWLKAASLEQVNSTSVKTVYRTLYLVSESTDQDQEKKQKLQCDIKVLNWFGSSCFDSETVVE